MGACKLLGHLDEAHVMLSVIGNVLCGCQFDRRSSLSLAGLPPVRI